MLLTGVLVTVTLLTAGPAGLVFLLVGGVPLFKVFAQFSRYYDFTVAESPDGLRLRHGLLQKTRQTVPPGRVQAVGFVQPFLWRQVAAGCGCASTSPAPRRARRARATESYTENVLLPVAPWPVALAIVARVLPGVDVLGDPARSRRRSARGDARGSSGASSPSGRTTRCSSRAAGASPSGGTSCRTRAPSRSG